METTIDLMKRTIILLCFFLFFSIGVTSQTQPFDQSNLHKTSSWKSTRIFHGLRQTPDSSIIYLGNPFKKRYPDTSSNKYARSVWDMCYYNGKIYFGHGDFQINVGPIDLWCYDIPRKQFINEFRIDDEEVNRLRVFDGALYVPGIDAKESWSLGNFYVNYGSGWKKMRTIPNGIHVWEIYKFHNKLFTSIRTPNGGAILSSDDSGTIWKNYNVFDTLQHNEVYEFFIHKDTLYGSVAPGISYKYNGTVFEKVKPNFLPSNERTYNYTNYHGELIYRSWNSNNQLFKASTSNSFSTSNLFNDKTISDITVRDDTLYLLMFRNILGNRAIEVYSSTGDNYFNNWYKEFEIITNDFPRSFEYFDGSFYIGIGSYWKPYSADSTFSEYSWGDIYRIKKNQNRSTDIPEIHTLSFKLDQNFPNPFTGCTAIGYRLSASGNVRLEVFDILGRKVATLFNEEQEAGVKRVEVKSKEMNLNNGIYFYQLEANGQTIRKKMIVLQ